MKQKISELENARLKAEIAYTEAELHMVRHDGNEARYDNWQLRNACEEWIEFFGFLKDRLAESVMDNDFDWVREFLKEHE